MPKVSPAQVNFNTGELSPSMYGRTDFDNYRNALATCLNMVPTVQGGVTSRPGTYFVKEVKDSTKATRLVPFEYSTTQAYILEFGDQYIRFYKNEAQILGGSTEFITNTEFATDYTGWTKSGPGTATWSASYGGSVLLDATAGATYIRQQIDNLIVGETYTVLTQFQSSSAGIGMRVRTAPADTAVSPVSDTRDPGTFLNTLTFVATTTSVYIDVYESSISNYVSSVSVIGPSSITPYEVSTPYLEADLFQLKFAQSADVLYIAHPSYAPRTLSRASDTSWTLAQFVTEWGPFLEENLTEAYVITASAATGTGITLTASGGHSPFTSSMVGAYIQFRELLSSRYNKWETNKSITSGDYRYYDGRLYQAGTTTTTGTRPPVHETGTESDGAVDWTFVRIDRGYAQITAYTSGTVVTADVKKTLPASATSGVFRWAEGAWSSRRGYPGAVLFYEDRLCWAGSTAKPQTLWLSQSGVYDSFKTVEPDGVVADDNAMVLTLNANDVNAIRWLADEERAMIIGTVGGEWTLRASDASAALTPTNIQAKRSTTYGTANVQALRAGRSTIYVQKAGRKLRELAYVFEIDGFRAPDLTVLSDHITVSGVKDMSFQQEPQAIIWCVLNDGTLVGLTYEREQKVVGWHRHELGGVFGSGNAVVESVASIPNPSGDADQLWMVVKRTINSTTKRYVEFLTPFFEHNVTAQEDAFFVDCGGTYDGSPTTTVTGLSHLEGETVKVLADGAVHPDVTVSSGSISLSRSASVVQVGLGYNRDIQTLRLESGAADGTAQAKTKRIHRMAVRFLSTLGVKMGPTFDKLTPIVFRTSADPAGSAPPLFSGDISFNWEGDYETEAQVCLRVYQPLPCTVLALYPQLHTQDRG